MATTLKITSRSAGAIRHSGAAIRSVGAAVMAKALGATELIRLPFAPTQSTHVALDTKSQKRRTAGPALRFCARSRRASCLRAYPSMKVRPFR